MAIKENKKSQWLKNITILLFVICMSLGIGQAFFIYRIEVVDRANIARSGPNQATCMALMPECGVCLDETIGDVCVKRYTKIVRGYPLYTTGSGGEYKTNQPLGWVHAMNFFLFLIPVFLLFTISKYENNRTKYSTKR